MTSSMVNPYESPTPSKGKRNRRGTYFFRGLAVIFWLLALFILVAYWALASTPGDLEDRGRQPLAYWILAAVVFLLPAAGFAVLGMASWLKRGWLAILGIAAFTPLIVALTAPIIGL